MALDLAALYSARTVLKLEKNDTSDFSEGATRAVCCGTPGTANFVDEDGNSCTDYPLQQGYNPISIRKLKTGGTADDIWGLF